MGNQGGPWTCSRSMPTPLGKHTTHNPRSTRPDRYLQAWRKLSLMPGMATTASLYIRKTDTWPLSSHRGGDTAIESRLKVMSLLGDGYSRRFDEIVSDVPDKTKCIDDTILWATDLEASFHQATKWLDLCGRSGITLNPEKFVFGADTVEFAGFEVTRDSVRSNQKYLRAIRSFPTHHNITDIRSWFGLINQVAYTFSMTERMPPFRPLLRTVSMGWHFAKTVRGV